MRSPVAIEFEDEWSFAINASQCGNADPIITKRKERMMCGDRFMICCADIFFLNKSALQRDLLWNTPGLNKTVNHNCWWYRFCYFMY